MQLAFGGEELEGVYGSAKLRKEVTTHKLEPHQVVLEELKLGTVEPPLNRIETRTRLNDDDDDDDDEMMLNVLRCHLTY